MICVYSGREKKNTTSFYRRLVVQSQSILAKYFVVNVQRRPRFKLEAELITESHAVLAGHINNECLK